MILSISPDGTTRCLYTEEIDLAAIGKPMITRASYVEPDERGQWFVDMAPVDGPCLIAFPTRSEALAAEVAWLEENVL